MNSYGTNTEVQSERLRSLIRRLFSFEEPLRKAAQLRRLAGKFEHEIGTGTEEFDKAVAPLFVHEPTTKDRMFSVAFAISYAERFSNSAFEVWHAGSMGNEIDSDVSAALCDSFSGTATWCQTFVSCRIPWSFLLDVLPAGDPYGRFIATTLSDLNEMSSASAAIGTFRKHLELQRQSLPTEFFPNAVFIVEGATEQVLMPTVAHCMNSPFERMGVYIMSAGGANQVLKKFRQLRQSSTLPLFAMLDRDASNQAEAIKLQLQENDKLFVFEEGEIEDTFSEEFFVSLLNAYMQSAHVSSKPLEPVDFSAGRKTEIAQRLLRKKASIDFDKVKFAKIAASLFSSRSDIPPQLQCIVETVASTMASVRNENR